MNRSDDIYSISEELDNFFGKEGSKERNTEIIKAWEEYNAQILLEARKSANMTQQQVADKIGASKGYVSKVERGLIVPTIATFYKMAAAMGKHVELQ